ncbi:SH3 domain-containing protein [Anoxybacteroides amylolyticum]|uniref:Bacterial SH3 domain protein n=1 Tax=Anoxybacteroides amylolyticum TaxID=294699 RepID=A0A160F403_9BACL|nr:SH3 domain-containing protein [Anoxybacillus amylolyticus]ANB60363.1 bacterial SH3 domain protein [Anoxybacillus amylolyticus]
MNAKKWTISLGLTIGIVTGSIFFTPTVMKASEEVILASVDWVTAQLNPLKTQIATLQSKIDAQQKEIDSLKQQLAKQAALPSTVYAAKSKTAVRSGASTSYKIVAYKNAGESLKVISALSSSQGVWYYVQASSTVKGWVSYSDVSITKGTAISNQKTVVTIAKTNIRKGASTSYPIIETVERGAMLLFIQSFTNTQGEIWYNVQTNNGKRGWMAGYLGEVK